MQRTLVWVAIVLVLIAMGAVLYHVINGNLMAEGVPLPDSYPAWLYGAILVLGAVWLYYMIYRGTYEAMLSNIYRHPKRSALWALMISLAVLVFAWVPFQATVYYWLWAPGPLMQDNLLLWMVYLAAGPVVFGLLAALVGGLCYARGKR